MEEEVVDRSEYSPFQRAIEAGLVEKFAEHDTPQLKMGRKHYDWKPLFLTSLMDGMTIDAAAKSAGLADSEFPRRLRHKDPDFRAAWNEAADIGTRLLEQEAQRRAYHGISEPVYHNGQVVGHNKKYSDLLLIFLLKARKPEVYRESSKSQVANISIQTNIAAGDTIRRMIQSGQLGGAEEAPTPALTDASSDSGFGGQVEGSPPSDEAEQGTDEGMEHAKQ